MLPSYPSSSSGAGSQSARRDRRLNGSSRAGLAAATAQSRLVRSDAIDIAPSDLCFVQLPSLQPKTPTLRPALKPLHMGSVRVWSRRSEIRQLFSERRQVETAYVLSMT